MKIAMISCQQAAMLGAKKSFNALSLVERIKLRMHLKMCTCVNCHNYAKDSVLIDEAVEKILQQKEDQAQTLSQEQRDKILQALD